MRGEVKTRCLSGLAAAFGIPGDYKPHEIEKIITWLVDEGKDIFVFGKVDVKVYFMLPN